MKKLMALFVCVIVCLSFAGCNNTESQNKTASEALTEVLNKERSFTFKSPVFDKVTEETLERFGFATESNALNVFQPQSYAFVDLDADGIEEMIIVDTHLQFVLALRYETKQVYGYILERVSLQDIKTDGSFLRTAYQGYKAISRVSFNGVNFEVSNLAYIDDSENIYILDGEPAEKSEVLEYFDNWNESTEKISWMTIE